MTLAQRYHDEGDVARISYKLAALSTADQMVEDPQGVERLLFIAQTLKKKIELGLELEESEKGVESEYAYDRLVCGYFR